MSLRIGVMCFSMAICCSAQQFPALTRSQFTEAAPQGFGDRQNSWAWSMAWFNGKLYVGTSRAYLCADNAAINMIVPVYPPKDPDVSCTADPTDLNLAAEIWSWTPATNTWALAYRSPTDLLIPGTTKPVARDIGYRGMLVFHDPSGVDALYVGSCSSKSIYGGLPGARILRSADGINFSPVPQTAGTFLATLNNGCFRDFEAHNNKLYALAGSFRGAGVVVESADPSLGNNSFRQITPSSASAYEFASFNGFLYVSFNDEKGFQLYKTPASGALPYTFTPVLLDGGYKLPNGNPGALSMKVFNGSLYVGGNSMRTVTTLLCTVSIACAAAILQNGGAELFRVNADDTWDLIVGAQRQTPTGLKTPLSGIGAGFSWGLNQHLWRMEVFDNRLYVGTYDISTELRRTDGTTDPLATFLGFDFWQTTDGTHFTAIDIRGFGDKFSYGARSLLATPSGLFLGTANPYYGLRIYRGVPGN
jgi:hypothetical protein